ncbi:hypothetical protein RRG08_067048 [Elysia crispata]|nr:hypothetical protein RRG08_067048 [Elysia crispata]
MEVTTAAATTSSTHGDTFREASSDQDFQVVEQTSVEDNRLIVMESELRVPGNGEKRLTEEGLESKELIERRLRDDRPAVRTSTDIDPHIDEELNSISSSAVPSEVGSLVLYP